MTNPTSPQGDLLATYPVPERPPLPRPERINRNALTVAAVLLGLLVIAAVVFMPADRPATQGAAPQATPDAIPPTPTYVDHPQAGGNSATGPRGSDRTASAAGRLAVPPPHSDAAGDSGGVPAYADLPRTYSVAPYSMVPATESPRSSRLAAYRAALDAPLVASPGQSPATLLPFDSVSVASPATSGVAPAAANAHEPSSAIWGRHQVFIADVSRTSSTTVRTSVAPAPGPYAIQAGTLIPAVLVTEINSDLPGAVLAQVARDVYDSRFQQSVLLPRGSRLLGTYEHQVAVGQSRMLVAWTRVIFPDGRSITLPGLETKDQAGAGGVRDQVDRHTKKVFGTAALLSLVGAAVQLSQPNGGYGPLGAYPSPGQIAAGAAGQQLAQVATQMLQRDLAVQQTVRIRQGTAFNVFVSADLTFPEPYREVR